MGFVFFGFVEFWSRVFIYYNEVGEKGDFIVGKGKRNIMFVGDKEYLKNFVVFRKIVGE